MAAGAASPLLQRAAAAQTAPKARNIVLVHGLFADGSCWSEVIARLQPKGLQVTSVQNPLTTLPEAVAAAQRVLAMQDGPTVLVGHSFSGMIVTEAGVDPKVSAVVYVAARAPDAGEDYTELAKKFPTPPASAGIVWFEDWGQLSEEAFLRDFAGDLPADKARVLYALQEPFKRTLLAGKTTHAAWRSKPSWYAVSTEDRTIIPDLERFMAKRMGAKTIEVKSSHLSLISHPDTIANLILQSGHSGRLFDHLVGSGEQSRRDNKPERFGRLQVDDELKLGRPQDRQVGRSLALKNAPAIDAGLANEVRKVRSVAHQSPSFDHLTIGIDRWQPMVRRQRDEVYATAVEERIVIDQECVNLLRPEARKGHVNLAIGARGKDFNLPPNRHSCCPRVCDRGLSSRGIVWIDEHGKTCGLRQQLVQEPKQFARKLKVH